MVKNMVQLPRFDKVKSPRGGLDRTGFFCFALLAHDERIPSLQQSNPDGIKKENISLPSVREAIIKTAPEPRG
jgi:hypothetical protein